MFQSGIVNLKRNPGVGSIPQKFIVIFKQAQGAVELSNRTGSRSRSKSADINSTVRSYLYPVNRTPTDDLIYGEGMSFGEGRKIGDRYWYQQNVKVFTLGGFHLPSLQGNQTPDRNRYLKR